MNLKKNFVHNRDIAVIFFLWVTPGGSQLVRNLACNPVDSPFDWDKILQLLVLQFALERGSNHLATAEDVIELLSLYLGSKFRQNNQIQNAKESWYASSCVLRTELPSLLLGLIQLIENMYTDCSSFPTLK